jgi:hypothetical protein
MNGGVNRAYALVERQALGFGEFGARESSHVLKRDQQLAPTIRER